MIRIPFPYIANGCQDTPTESKWCKAKRSGVMLQININ